MSLLIQLFLTGLAVLLVAVASYFFRQYRRAAHPRSRNVHDTIAFLRPLNLEDLEDVLDDTTETYLELNLPTHRFKDVQKMRTSRFLEHLGRMVHNSRFLSEWAHHERLTAWTNGDQELEASCTELVRACIETAGGVRSIQFAIFRWRMKSAMFPFVKVLHLAPLASFGSYNVLTAYERMANAALALCHVLDPETEEMLGQSL